MSADPRVQDALRLYAEGHGPTAIGREVGANHSTIESWLRVHLHTTCTRCAEPLLKPSVEGLCGFCAEETAGVAA